MWPHCILNQWTSRGILGRVLNYLIQRSNLLDVCVFDEVKVCEVYVYMCVCIYIYKRLTCYLMLSYLNIFHSKYVVHIASIL
jgi:hypothetical protein